MLWVRMQAAEDGSLAFLVSRVRTQPQVYTAYAGSAPIRSKELTAEFQAAVLPLKVTQHIWQSPSTFSVWPLPTAVQHAFKTAIHKHFAFLQGTVRFSTLEAAKKGAKALAIHAAAGDTPGKVIEARDAAPATRDAAEPGSAPGKEAAEGMARRLQQSATDLAHAWEARRGSQRAAASSAPAQDQGRPPGHAADQKHVPASETSSGPGPGHDMGHLSAGDMPPIPEEADTGRTPHVWVQLSVEESSLEGLAMFTSVRVRLLVAEAGSGAAHGHARARDGRQAAGAVAGSRLGLQLPNIGGLLRPPAWVGARSSAASQALEAESQSAHSKKDAERASGVSPAADAASLAEAEASQLVSAPPAEKAAAQGSVNVCIVVKEGHAAAKEGQAVADDSSADGQQPCSVVLHVREEAAAAGPSGIGRFAGLFRSSRNVAAPSQRPKDAAAPTETDMQPGTAPPLAADMSEQSPAKAGAAATAPADMPTPPPTAQQQQGWGLGGAMGSLYGIVSHAAEATLRSAQQHAAGSSEPSTPVSGGDHFSSMRAAVAGSSGVMPTQAAVAPPDEDAEAAAAAAELVLRLKMCASALLQVQNSPFWISVKAILYFYKVTSVTGCLCSVASTASVW